MSAIAQVSYSPLSPGAPENVNSLNTILAAITAGVNSVDSTQLASSSVATAAIQSGAVTAGKIASGAVSYDKLTTFPHARVYGATNSLSDSTFTTVTFPSETYDTEAIHSTSANTGRLTCVTAGLYYIGGYVEFTGNSTGNRKLITLLNGSTTIDVATQPGIASLGCAVRVGTIYRLAANDYVTLSAYQNSGGSLSLISGEFWMAWIGA